MMARHPARPSNIIFGDLWAQESFYKPSSSQINLERSHFMIKQCFSLKKLGLPVILAVLLLLLLAGPALSATVELLSDGFERPVAILFQLWDGNGATEWSYNPSTPHSGLRAARATNNNEGYLT